MQKTASVRCGVFLVFLTTAYPLAASLELRGLGPTQLAASLGSLAKDLRQPESGLPVWVWWDYKDKPPAVVQACLNSWKIHAAAPQFDLRLVNASVVRAWLPDLPEEYDRLPYVAATSDFVRAALLAKYGGVYLDTDVLLLRNLANITEHLYDSDFVAYTNIHQHCEEGLFSSNIIAANKGNPLSVAWHEKAVQHLKQKCKLPEKEDLKPEQGVCCYTPDGAKREKCHVNWGGVGEMVAHPVAKELLVNKNASGFNMFCFQEIQNEGFSPTGSDDYVKPFGTAGAPCHAEGNDLACEGKPIRKDLFNRIALHLFHSVWHLDEHKTDLFNGGYVISELIRRSLIQ